MRDLIKLYNECVRDMKNLGIPVDTNKIRKVFVNGRMSRAYGKTYRKWDSYESEHYFEIAIIPCVLDENVPSHVCRSICYHEILHTLDGCFAHNKKFHNYCDLIEDCLGVKMGTYVDKGYMAEIKANTITPQRRRLEYKWEYHCPKCGHVYRDKRRPNGLAYYPSTNEINYCCGKCKGTKLILDKHGDMSKVERRYNFL